MRLNFFHLSAIFLLLSFFAGCKQEIVPKLYHPRNEHDAYLHSLENANLLEAALGKDWLEASRMALDLALKAETPHNEAFYLDPSKAESVGYRFSVMRGQKIEIEVTPFQSDTIQLFIDLFRVDNDSLKLRTHVASADSANHQLAFEPRKDADYILRLQPELLRGGRFTIAIQSVPSYTFPVAGRSSRAIGSRFGDPRDGGKRDHHGVDIFAKRHTPIIAPTKAYVRSVTTKKLGGNVIWLRDEKGNNLYFAHLQTQLAKRNTYVNPGDTIGTVGNTGNARTTPPHLHFGIYKRGPIDPINFIKETKTDLPEISANLELIGNWARTNERTVLKLSNSLITKFDTLDLHHPMQVIGAAQTSYRVVLPNGKIGYIDISKIEPTSEPISNQVATAPIELLTAPNEKSIAKTRLPAGANLSVLAKQEGFWFVRTSIGQLGWVQGI